jgi:hypothetical protein
MTTKALLLFHRGHEHSGRWQDTVAALDWVMSPSSPGTNAGHGRSPGEPQAADVATVIGADE